jgi:plasmid stabilization system protein ParE
MISAKPLIWSPEADQDLANTLHYLEQHWSYPVNQDFIIQLFNTLDWITSDPDTLLTINQPKNIRKFVLSVHQSLYFEISDTHIYLL